MKNLGLGCVASVLVYVLVGCGDSDGGGGPELLVEPRAEPAGKNCSAGGTALASGTDANGNGMLDPDEVAGLDFVCNGVGDGAGGGDGAQLVAIMTLPEGDDDCPGGGVAILTGADTDGDGMLDADEVEGTELVCNASAVAATLVDTQALDVGDADCPNGGVSVAQGTDDNGNGELDADEVDSVSYACNGEPADVADSCAFPAEWDANAAACVVRGDWSGADLADADLGSIYLAGTDFSGADLSGADLSWSELRGADLSGADLTGADLSNASVDGADFTDAVLTGANLAGVDLDRATLDGVTANDLVACPDDLPEGWDCVDLGANGLTLLGPGATLNGLDLTGADLSEADLRGVQASDLQGCPDELPDGWQCLDLGPAGWTLVGRGADLSDLDLSGADFTSITDLRDVNFNGSDLTGATFANGTDFEDATFVGADLTGVDLSNTDLNDVRAYDLDGCPADLPTDWDCLSLPHTGHTLVGPDADLSGLNLSGADLSNANLDNANLNDADLSGAMLDGADLTDASLQDADLTGASLIGADLNNADLDGAMLDGVTAAELLDCPDQLPNNWDCIQDGGGDFVLVGPGADLGGLSLDLSGADLSGVDLTGADLSGADLSGADVNSADFAEANLSGVTATDVQDCPDSLPDNWECIQDGDGNNLLIGPEAGLGGIALNLSGVELSGMDLTGIDLTEADLSNADLIDTVLVDATLVDADLTSADLTDADLTGADLSGATLTDVTWDNTTCPSGVNSDSNGNTCP